MAGDGGRDGMKEGNGMEQGVGWKSRVEEGCRGEGWRGMKEGMKERGSEGGGGRGMGHLQQEI